MRSWAHLGAIVTGLQTHRGARDTNVVPSSTARISQPATSRHVDTCAEAGRLATEAAVPPVRGIPAWESCGRVSSDDQVHRCSATPSDWINVTGLFDDLTAGYHILAANGHEYLRLGHLTTRSHLADTLWIKEVTASLAEVEPSKMKLVNFDGEIVQGSGKAHIEVPLHAEIYRRRKDVNAIVHTHALEAAALAASSSQFRMVSQHSVYFSSGVGHYDSSHLVNTRERGEALADALSDMRAVTLRNHGLVTVGRSIHEAVVLAVCFVNSLRVQIAAASLGDVIEIPADEVVEMSASLESNYEGNIDRVWQSLYDDMH